MVVMNNAAKRGGGMNWKDFTAHFEPMTCVLSVEKKPDGRYGTIRIVTGNDKYIDSVALAAGGIDMGSDQKAEFIPNSEYTRYIPKDLNFEDVCYRCAVLKQPIHNCLRASRYPFDIMVYMLPMESDDEQLGYCTFTQVLIPKSDDNLLALNISQETAREVINTCIKLREDKPFHEIMQTVVEDVRGICDADFCSVLLMDDSKRQCPIIGKAISPKSKRDWPEEELGHDFYDIAQTWLDTMAGSYCLVIRDAHDMEYIRERNPRWYQSLQEEGVECLVLFPLMLRNRLLGYIMAINFDTRNTQHIRDTLELTTFFIASEIANNQFIDRLKALNETDMLTGVLNRNAMNARVSALEDAGDEVPSGMGVVFADMNGLKRVNDQQGHIAGDMLLKNAAVILQSTFVGDEIFRVGGDEFLVLLRNTDEADMRRKIAEIKKKAELFQNVSFAAGCSLLSRAGGVHKALAEADTMMYADKEECYRAHPELKR